MELTRPALFKSHKTLPAFACEMPSRSAICASVRNSPPPSRASCSRQRRPYSSRSEEHTSELQSLAYLVCRLLLEKKKTVLWRSPQCSAHFLIRVRFSQQYS